ncbi:polysaccharide biosynthesis tyrosine autokinase [Cohnella thailandensis]|uniref:non-specific protein-tyrosine kinase n=1 Tax=Cohnella thailandensis TaxID=557557 RepID=A0A841T1W5_9BACL|nr:CpsD/CapB family tyrosine-protein kinase [Cohnella thailandensis]MBP1971921.1 capsular exopolysaccharide synthesis family protein [Cohnella thailandensis]
MSAQANKRYLVTEADPKSPVSESYRTLRTNIDFSSIDGQMQVLMVTSAGPGEGKSTTIGNLAVAYAQSERKVVLIDADLRKPTEHYTFQISNRIGLSSVLSNQAELGQAIQDTHIPYLSVIPSGPIPPNPAEMLASQRMSKVLEELKQQFDVILIDAPPVLAVTDAQLLSTRCDGVILVMDYGKVKKDVALKSKSLLDKVGAKVLGVVLNNVKRKKNEGYYYYYYGSPNS